MDDRWFRLGDHGRYVAFGILGSGQSRSFSGRGMGSWNTGRQAKSPGATECCESDIEFLGGLRIQRGRYNIILLSSKLVYAKTLRQEVVVRISF